MPRLSADTWETVLAEREAGATFADLASRFGVSDGAIVRPACRWYSGMTLLTDLKSVATRTLGGKPISTAAGRCADWSAR